MTGTVLVGDCLVRMAEMEPSSVDAVITDPPYGLTSNKKGGSGVASVNLESPYGRARVTTGNGTGGFMGQKWDASVPGPEVWAAALRLAKPGAHLLAFGGTRTYHRLTCAIEDAGWEIRDCLTYLYGSGFPKSLNCNRDDRFCSCSEASAKHRVRFVSGADLSPSVQPEPAARQILLAGLPEPGAPTERTQAAEDVRGGESGMEGRRDAEAPQGELLGSALRAGAGMGAANGESGRLLDGASVGNGDALRTAPEPSGSRASSGPRPGQQRPDEPRTLADERRAQAGGIWPVCGGCGKPRIPSGLGTALKPSWEPIILARKPLIGTVASNVQQHGTGALNIDGCRIEATAEDVALQRARTGGEMGVRATPGVYDGGHVRTPAGNPSGRWPANVVLDQDSAAMLDEQSGADCGAFAPVRGTEPSKPAENVYGEYGRHIGQFYGDRGGASRFFYTAKASRSEREAMEGAEGQQQAIRSTYDKSVRDGNGGDTGYLRRNGGDTGYLRRNHHPTVKPLDLMRWLVRLVTPPNGLILDPFCGSGTTGCAALAEGFRFIGIEREPEYAAIAEARLNATQPGLSLNGGAA
jgi:DNA modification methylase